MLQVGDDDAVGPQRQTQQPAGKCQQADAGVFIASFLPMHPFISKAGFECRLRKSSGRRFHAGIFYGCPHLDLRLRVIRGPRI